MELKLFGIFGKSANINKQWVHSNGILQYQNVSFKLVEIQNPCVILEEVQSKKQHKICLRGAQFIQSATK